jgi:hypothetical protein
MLSRKNIDELSQPSRDFYERAKLKMSYSLLFVSLALFFLGLSSQAGGESEAADFRTTAAGGKYKSQYNI